MQAFSGSAIQCFRRAVEVYKKSVRILVSLSKGI